MSLPLPNPQSPASSTVLNRLIRTRKCLNSLRDWVPVVGAVREYEIGQPFVSVMLITYNHEKYVREALDSILMQIRDFSIEINVIDDASTDKTQEIVREYEHQYPDIINCYFNTVNVGHIATQLNTFRGFQTLRGRYFAILEGDDYWTDVAKLAKQVAFLEGNAECVACAHNTLKVFDDNRRPPEHFLPFRHFKSNVANIYDLISMSGVFHLSSIVYRNVFRRSPPPCLYDQYSCEVTINMLYGLFGHFHCLDEYMSVYRVHDGGVFSSRTQEKHWRFHLFGFSRFSLYLGPKYWCMFATAVRGFSRYVLRAPFKSQEVAGLSKSSWALFGLHFIIATGVTFVCFPGRIGAFAARRLRSAFSNRGMLRSSLALKKILRHPGIHMLLFLLYGQRKMVRFLPASFLRVILRKEQSFPRWLEARRVVRDWIIRKANDSV